MERHTSYYLCTANILSAGRVCGRDWLTFSVSVLNSIKCIDHKFVYSRSCLLQYFMRKRKKAIACGLNLQAIRRSNGIYSTHTHSHTRRRLFYHHFVSSQCASAWHTHTRTPKRLNSLIWNWRGCVKLVFDHQMKQNISFSAHRFSHFVSIKLSDYSSFQKHLFFVCVVAREWRMVRLPV